MPKKDIPRDSGAAMVPTTDHVWRMLAGGQVYGPLINAAQEIRNQARLFHWTIEFPDVFAKGGFDLMIGNPPWERIKLQEQELFASRDPDIAAAPTANARGKMIAQLKNSSAGSRERRLHDEFEQAKRTAEAASIFTRESGRFPLTGRGDVNTYALFAELFVSLSAARGTSAMILPMGIATDASTSPFWTELIERGRVKSLHSFENEEFIFQNVHHAFRFSLLTVLGSKSSIGPDFVFFA
jgi:xanthine/CO dehydrogenase XdhC/CoxF family maturation factor